MKALPLLVSLVLTNIGLILVNRSLSSSLWRAISGRNPTLWAVMAIVLPLLLVAVSWGPLEALFRFGPLHGDDLGISIGAALLLLLTLEVLKRLWQARLVQ